MAPAVPAVPVGDPSDPRVADYVGLTDAELRRRVELPGDGGQGLFVAEGPHVIRRLLRSGWRLRSLLLTPHRLEGLERELAGVEAPVYVAAPAVMDAIAGFHIHRGALAAADRRPLPEPGALLTRMARVAVLEGISDHENLGAIFRSAAALGIGAILLSPDCCDPLYRRAVRVSMGHVLDVPYATLEPWPGGLAAISDAGFRLVALIPTPAADPIDEVGLRAMERVALMLGAEDRGLTPAAVGRADVLARVPMTEAVDSLNVAAAAAIAFHAAGGVRKPSEAGEPLR